jgi:hypothetical protein
MDDGVSLHQGRAHDPLPAPAGIDLLPVRSQAIVLAAAESRIALDFVSWEGLPGIRDRLERPPR